MTTQFRSALLLILTTIIVSPAHAITDVDVVVSQLNDTLKNSKQKLSSSASEQTLDTNSANIIQPNIIGGNDASRNEYPEYTLLIITESSGGGIVKYCGGTLIAPNKVLTSAHCTSDPTYTYFMIPNFYSFNDEITSSSIYDATSITTHPSYNSANLDYDIAVITMTSNAPYSTAKIHKGNNQFVSIDGTVVGTGATRSTPSLAYPDNLQEIQTTITSNQDCSDEWVEQVGDDPINQTKMCAGSTNNGNGSCYGDDGGPLWVSIAGQRTLVGSYSFGTEFCENNRATQTYARLSEMTSFIESASPQTSFIESDSGFTLAPITSWLLNQ